jgi:hypothetical protein
MRNLACISILTISLLSATSPALAGGGANQKTDPCLLVTPQEIGEALQDQVGPGQNSGAGDCNYRGASGYDSQVSIAVDENPGRPEFFASQAARDNIQRFDIADGAFAFDSPAGFTAVTVLKGETLVTITLSRPNLKRRLDATVALAEQAAVRLGTGAALHRESGLEALVGEWYTDAGDPNRGNREVRRWVIEKDGHWAMTMAPEHAGMIAAQGGHWEVDSPQEHFAGSYKANGKNRLTTEGDVAAEWIRIPDGARPEGVDSVFLGIWSQIPLGGMAHGPIDPAMVGLWRAEVESDGAKTIMVWRIPPDGYAVLTPIVTVEGELEADEGTLKIEPNQGDGFQSSYKFQGSDAFVTTDESGSFRWQRKGTGLW